MEEKNENKIIRTNRYGDLATLLGRILIGGVFLFSGFKKIIGFSGIVSFINSVSFPFPTISAILAILIEVGLGFSLIIGYKTKLSGILLAIFVLIITPIFHNPLISGQMINFTKNLMIIGGLLFVSSFGAGRISIDYKILKKG